MGTADEKNTFSKNDTKNWADKLYTITEIINDTMASYHINNLSERYNEALLKKSELTKTQNRNGMIKIKIRLNQNVFDHHY